MPVIPGPNQKLPGTNFVICEHGLCVKQDANDPKHPLHKHCRPKPGDECEDNPKKDEHYCHCRAFQWIPKKKEWEDKGTEPFEDDDDIYCFCVRLPRG
jgi:hypothetical protein